MSKKFKKTEIEGVKDLRNKSLHYITIYIVYIIFGMNELTDYDKDNLQLQSKCLMKCQMFPPYW